MNNEEIVCNGCGEPITDYDYHDGHEKDCPNYLKRDNKVECYCDLKFHEECCPECIEWNRLDAQMWDAWETEAMYEVPY